MELTSITDASQEEKVTIEADSELDSTSEDSKKDLKKVSISTLEKDVKEKPFDDNFEVK
jgi:hypothetical protein